MNTLSHTITRRFYPPVTRLYKLARSSVTQRYFITGITRYFHPDKIKHNRLTEQNIASESSHLLAINSLFAGIYTILQGPLGTVSGQADVYKCIDKQTQQKVALKLYRIETQPKAQVLKQLQGLVHPNLVSIISFAQWQGQFYEVMELCQGGSLADKGSQTEQQLQAYLVQVIAGLNYCHQQGIVHTDVKPANLFFRDSLQQTLLLGDFGTSSYFSPDSSQRITSTTAHLTLDYAAPELLDGNHISPAIDYYALGISLIHLLIGESPFTGLSHNNILVARWIYYCI